jgi:hypothetical protein
MTDKEAIKLAIATLDEVRNEAFRLVRNGQRFYAEEKVWNTVTALKERLAQPQRTWVGLTDEDVMEVWEKIKDGDWAIDFYDVIEAKLKENNK